MTQILCEPILIEVSPEPLEIEVVNTPIAIESFYAPFLIESNQSTIVIEYEVNELFQRIQVSSLGQTVFILNNSPAVPDNVKVFLGGIFISNSYYNIVGSTLTLLPSFPVTLEVSDSLDIYYY